MVESLATPGLYCMLFLLTNDGILLKSLNYNNGNNILNPDNQNYSKFLALPGRPE